MDPLIAEAHLALAVMYARETQWKESEASFRRAIELDSNDARIYKLYWYWLLFALGRNEEALQQVYASGKADPLATRVQIDLAWIPHFAASLR